MELEAVAAGKKVERDAGMEEEPLMPTPKLWCVCGGSPEM